MLTGEIEDLEDFVVFASLMRIELTSDRVLARAPGTLNIRRFHRSGHRLVAMRNLLVRVFLQDMLL